MNTGNDEVSLIQRNKYLCRSCKKLLISKESLDSHIIICYESRIDKLREDYKKEIEKSNLEYEKEIKKIKSECDQKIDEIVEYMTNHINTVEQKHITLNNYLISQIKTLSNL